MKTALTLLALIISVNVFATTPYKIIKNKWSSEDEVILTGVTGDLFGTHELLSTRGPGWKKAAEAFIEDKTEAVEISQQIEDYTVVEACRIRGDVEYIETDSFTFRWKALKPVRSPNAQTVLYVVQTFADYQVYFPSGKSFKCPYLINEYVFLNAPAGGKPFGFLGKLKK